MEANPLVNYIGANAINQQADNTAHGNVNEQATLQQLDGRGHDGWFIKRRDQSSRAALCDLANNLTHFEYRQIHRYHHAADQRAEHHHDDRFHQAGQRCHRIVHFALVEIRYFA